VINANHLHEYMMRGASIGHFSQFILPHLNNNISL
jgi:hypothetical protein